MVIEGGGLTEIKGTVPWFGCSDQGSRGMEGGHGDALPGCGCDWKPQNAFAIVAICRARHEGGCCDG